MMRFPAIVFAFAFTVSAAAEGPPTMAQMMAEADREVFATAAAHTGGPAALIPRLIDSRTASAMLRIYSRNWPAVKAHAEACLNDLPFVEPGAFGKPRATFSFEEAFEEAGAAVQTLFLKREEGLLTLRFFDPTSLAQSGYGMATGARMPARDIGLNAAAVGFASREVFRTELDGVPAIGISQGFWTVITIYSRSEHGLFAPAKMAIFDRRKEG